MVAPANEYLRSTFSGNAEAEVVQDYLNRLHPAVATLHALLQQGQIDSVKPTQMMADWPIKRTAADGAATIAAKSDGQSASIVSTRTPQRLFTRTQIIHEGVASSRTAQRIRLYGIEDSMDFGIDNSLVSVTDENERALHWSLGTEDAATSPPVPRMQGLASWAAWSGLERRHGTNGALTVVGDGLQAIPKTYWTSFFDAGGTPLTREMFYMQIIGFGYRLGHQVDGAWILCGDKVNMQFADFPTIPGRGNLNEREISARDAALVDIIMVVTTPTYGTVYLVPDRFMMVEGVSNTYNNTGGGFVGGTGTINRTVPWDTSLLSVMPAYFQISAIDNVQYKQLASDGDYAVGMVVSEKTLECAHTYGVIGGTRLAA